MNKISLDRNGFHFFMNAAAPRGAPYDRDGRRDILSLAAFEEAKREITAWPGYAPTPLRALPGLAAAAGVGAIWYKDEASRFGLGSFKGLGGAYAVLRLLQNEIANKTGRRPGSREIASGGCRDLVSKITVTCATDGNHGRSVAWGAKTFGCKCIVYVSAVVSEGRCRAIENFGAEIRRVDGTYDDAVRQAASDAGENGWFVVSDTSYEGYTEIPRDVMQGYSVMADEAVNALSQPASHVFVQGGVGGLAAAVCSYLWERFGEQRPLFAVVEPVKADCLYRSARAGRATPAEGDLDTIMAGLACGEVSLLAWEILKEGADAFLTVSDEAAAECMRLLADGRFGDTPIVAGESAVAGLAGFLLAAEQAERRERLGLNASSTVLLFGTEGATDPDVYRRIVGRSPQEIAS